jgi:DNA adenine methylase
VTKRTSQTRAVFDFWYARVGQARPFLKWAGGKQVFLTRWADAFPAFPGRYIEPFLGSGSVFFAVMRQKTHPCPSRLGDVNKPLIQTFLAVRDDPDTVYDRLASLQGGYTAATDKATFYYDIRDAYNAQHPRTDPAKFIFLNRTCWNGLYRVNQDGKFNVPFGAPKNPIVIPSRDELLNASAALVYAELRATHWMNTIAFAEAGDFVFLDPPYYSDLLEAPRMQPKYTSRFFSLRDHYSLADALRTLADRGVHFLLTNSADHEMERLYSSHGFSVQRVTLPRTINSVTDKRTGGREIIVTPTPIHLKPGPFRERRLP